MSDYNCADSLEQNTAVYAPITFEKIVIVMIRVINIVVFFLVFLRPQVFRLLVFIVINNNIVMILVHPAMK